MKNLLRIILKNIKEGYISKFDGLKLIEAINFNNNYYTKIHPLLHDNTSNLEEQKYTCIFNGNEFFLKDHVVAGNKVLPGVAYIEMARAALENSLGISAKTIILENIVWARPFVVNEGARKINIGLYPDDDGKIAYEIYGEKEPEDEEEVIYSQGRGRVLSEEKEIEKRDIEAVKKGCNRKLIQNKECYEIFEKMGINYGEGHRTIKELHVGNNQVLARLELSEEVKGTLEEYYLHPGMMDGALQATMGLMYAGNNGIEEKLGLPFALDSIEILGKSNDKMWAALMYAEGNKEDSKIKKVDIDICDEEGNIKVKMQGYTSRVLEVSTEKKKKI